MNKRQMKKLYKRLGDRRFIFNGDSNDVSGMLKMIVKDKSTYEVSEDGHTLKVILGLPKGFNSWTITARTLWLLSHTESG